MLLDSAIFFGIIAIVVLHIKTFLYYKIKNPNKSIFYGYITGLMWVYFVISLFPLSSLGKQKAYYQKLNNLTFIFYFFIGIFSLFIVLVPKSS